jgi:succinate dehydrogenase flavin-adding protein (antitoxin of CptAB toxin-antitoxin module)
MSRFLEQRIAELSDEIRRYPTPLARSDEQLTALIEQRAKLLLDLEKECCSPEALWTNDGGFNAA